MSTLAGCGFPEPVPIAPLVLLVPLTPPFPYISPALSPASFSCFTFASSLLGGLFGSSSADKAAKTQLQAVRATNALNKELAFQQNEWNLQQWNRQNAYNDPSGVILGGNGSRQSSSILT